MYRLDHRDVLACNRAPEKRRGFGGGSKVDTLQIHRAAMMGKAFIAELLIYKMGWHVRQCGVLTPALLTCQPMRTGSSRLNPAGELLFTGS